MWEHKSFAPILSAQCDEMQRICTANYTSDKNCREIERLKNEVAKLVAVNQNTNEAMNIYHYETIHLRRELDGAHQSINFLQQHANVPSNVPSSSSAFVSYNAPQHQYDDEQNNVPNQPLFRNALATDSNLACPSPKRRKLQHPANVEGTQTLERLVGNSLALGNNLEQFDSGITDRDIQQGIDDPTDLAQLHTFASTFGNVGFLIVNSKKSAIQKLL